MTHRRSGNSSKASVPPATPACLECLDSATTATTKAGCCSTSTTLELIITVVPPAKAQALLAGLRPLLDASSGVMFVTDTYVSRPEYFS